MSEEKPDMLYIELCKKGHSGFFQDDTIDTQNPIELVSASLTFIPTIGSRIIQWKDKNGKMMKKSEKIQWIKGEEIIAYDEQQRAGLAPERSGNVITIEKDSAIIVREGSTIGLHDYINDATYNESNPDRPAKATALYRTIKIDDKAEQMNEHDIQLADALIYIKSLSEKISEGKYTYKEDKIDMLCNLFVVGAETFPQKLAALSSYAKINPKKFIETVHKFEQTTITELSHGLQLDVWKFDGNVAVYVKKDKVIRNLGSEKLKHDQKIEQLASWFRTSEGNEAYTEYRMELELAQENALKTK